jgi:7-keto-8-aminopelargonate synthetase-like enzyme
MAPKLGVGKLTPLGDPAPNAPKWFAAVEIIRLASDKDWLHKATKEIAKYWRQKRQRYQCSSPAQPIL